MHEYMVAIFAVLLYMKLAGVGRSSLVLIILLPTVDMICGFIAMQMENAKRDEMLEELKKMKEEIDEIYDED